MHISCKDEILGSIPRRGTKFIGASSSGLRQMILIHSFVGSNPTAPAKFFFAVADYKGASVA